MTRRSFVTLAVALTALVAGAVGVRVSASRAGALQIGSVAYVAKDGTVKARATVRNDSDDTRTARVWWLLADETDKRPWLAFDYRSRVIAFEIAAHTTREFTWTEAVGAEPGVYRLSLWLHANEARGYEHADGEFADGVVRLPSAPSLQRRQGPSLEAFVRSVTVDPTASSGEETKVLVHMARGVAGSLPVTFVIGTETPTTRQRAVIGEATVSVPSGDEGIVVPVVGSMRPGHRIWIKLRPANSGLVLDEVVASIT